jgi:hypothetical protein
VRIRRNDDSGTPAECELESAIRASRSHGQLVWPEGEERAEPTSFSRVKRILASLGPQREQRLTRPGGSTACTPAARATTGARALPRRTMPACWTPRTAAAWSRRPGLGQSEHPRQPRDARADRRPPVANGLPAPAICLRAESSGRT